ncbi:ABC transporter ATP-binding protein [Halofilum ochraceum]|uniref:ABC transporter ATP-binding protein n=1 Tax=Halofilum ochraceum TaxID=1611323 RepID=UPI000A7DBE8C|nr:ABC transporter ATP-binding protein [Halofilum ochraceum]
MATQMLPEHRSRPVEPASSAERHDVLAMRDIRHAFGGLVAVDDVELDVRPHEVVCLLGPSGCGKTTLLRLAAGLETLQRGEVRIDGQLMAQAAGGRQVPPEHRNVGLMFQESALFPHLTVLENVTFGLDGLAPRERARRGRELLERLGMLDYAQTYPHMLSGGQQQRVALARALAPAPPLMLLDEPFSGLDTRLRDQIRDDTLHALKEVGTGTLLVTHDPEEAMFMADRIALMRHGRIVQAGPPVELYCHPVDPFVVHFFGDVNRLDGVVEGGHVDTVVGPIDVPDTPDGTPVQILVRPEAIHLVPLGEPMEVPDTSHVMVSRLLGRTSLIHVCAHARDGSEVHMHSRMPGVFLPPENQPVTLQLDWSQVFVFPGAG